MPIDITPIGNRVLVEQLKNRDVGKITLPDNIKEIAITRWVVSKIGDPEILIATSERLPIPVKEGQEVMFDSRRAMFCGPPAVFSGRTFAIVDADAIVAVFEGEPDVAVERKMILAA